jgi:hypothetical protein
VVVASEEVESSVLPRGDEHSFSVSHVASPAVCLIPLYITPPVAHYAFPNSNCETEA